MMTFQQRVKIVLYPSSKLHAMAHWLDLLNVALFPTVVTF